MPVLWHLHVSLAPTSTSCWVCRRCQALCTSPESDMPEGLRKYVWHTMHTVLRACCG